MVKFTEIDEDLEYIYEADTVKDVIELRQLILLADDEYNNNNCCPVPYDKFNKLCQDSCNN